MVTVRKPRGARVISNWATDPVALSRLEEVVLLTQRTDLIKQLLLIPDADEKQLKIQIKVILQKHQIDYAPPRGRPVDTKNPKQYGSKARFALAILLGLHLNNDDGGVIADGEGGICSTDVLDRLICAYHRYLDLQQVSPNEAVVSFDFFVKSWRAVQLGEAVLTICKNCGSTHGNFRIAMSHHCPVCSNLNLPELPKTRSKIQSVNFNPAANPEVARSQTTA